MIHSMSEKLEHKNNFGKREIYDYKKRRSAPLRLPL